MPKIDVVWQRIQAHAGETFCQIRGGEFSYEVTGGGLRLNRTNQILPKKHLAEALELVPLRSTVPVHHLRAPSYIYAILMDPRVSAGEW